MENPHMGLLCDVGELSALLAGSADISSFLQQTVSLVAQHLNAEVSSIYLYDDDTDVLVLRATVGLNPESVGQVRLSLGEGLVGIALKELRPLREDHASRNPHYRFFAQTQEERFEAFLAVPVLRGIERVGVLTAQREMDRPFQDQDLITLRVVAAQLASAIENARALMLMHGDTVVGAGSTSRRTFFKGHSASSGVVQAGSMILRQSRGFLRDKAGEGGYSLQDLDQALRETATQISALQRSMEARLPEAASLIFTAQLMMLKDQSFLGSIRAAVDDGTTVPEAIRRVGRRYMDLFAQSPHAYIREKAEDVEDVVRRILHNLLQAQESQDKGVAERIVIAEGLLPLDVLKLSAGGVTGIILVGGGVTSHVSILARSLGLPMVIVHEPVLLTLPESTPLLLDAEVGSVYVDPGTDILSRYQERESAAAEVTQARVRMTPQTHTADGVRIRLLANINLLSEVSLAQDLLAEGVGLYRTEFPFLVRLTFPTEEEQYLLYRRLVEGMKGKPITFRSLDIGGDKVLAYWNDAHEENPALGLRSIRFSLKHRDVFEQQLRAILRAGVGVEDLRIMFPMISSLEEFRLARNAVQACTTALARGGAGFHEAPQIGMMVELPAVTEIIDDLAAEVDFFSIGTNDFVQYMLGVDRGNEAVAAYYRPDHPAVLRAMARVVAGAQRHGREVSVCGEMANDPAHISQLLRLGVRTLSVDPKCLPRVQQTIRSLRLTELESPVSQDVAL